MKVIAIDPGYDRIGIAIMEKQVGGKETVLYSECFITNKADDLNKRIYNVGARVNILIREYNPQYLSIESLFFSKNTKTALSVSEARGVIIYQAFLNNIPVYEYTPNQIKLAVTGYGSATKKDVLFMVSRLVNLKEGKKIDDEIDAIAIGLTFLSSYRDYKTSEN